MTEDDLLRLLRAVAAGRTTPEEGASHLAGGPFLHDASAFADLDHHRTLRLGLAEAVYGEGKTPEEIVDIVERLSDRGSGANGTALVTRLSAEAIAALRRRHPDARINERARTCVVRPPPAATPGEDGSWIAVVAAGTSDLPVAEEAVETLVAAGAPHRLFCDVGVAGIHRLGRVLPDLRRAAACVVVAGMEGALPSVVGGLLPCPVFAVPTSVGYGAGFGGLAALLSGLTSCAPGVAVVNVDNGFGGASAALRVLRGAGRSGAASGAGGAG